MSSVFVFTFENSAAIEAGVNVLILVHIVDMILVLGFHWPGDAADSTAVTFRTWKTKFQLQIETNLCFKDLLCKILLIAHIVTKVMIFGNMCWINTVIDGCISL